MSHDKTRQEQSKAIQDKKRNDQNTQRQYDTIQDKPRKKGRQDKARTWQDKAIQNGIHDDTRH